MNDHIPAEDFAAYIDGMLSSEKKNELESHFSRCPACLDELLEIADIVSSRDTIPAQFLKRALGDKSKVTKSILHLRLVFEVAAVLVVAVFIGYLFLNNNRFWQTPEQQKPAMMADKNVLPGDTSTYLRDEKIIKLPAKQRERADASKANNERFKTDTDQRLADSLVSEKRKSDVGNKGAPAVIAGSVQTSVQKNELQEIAAGKPRPATAPAVVGAVQMDFAAKDQTSAKVMEKKAAEVEQKSESQKKPGTTVALPIEANVKENELKDEESTLRSPVAVSETAGAGQPVLGDKKQNAALTLKEIADKRTVPPIRIKGDVVWSDLLNPELIFTWSWFPKGLVLELQIDGAGTVVAVVPLGKFDQPLARQAENEAKKLLFSVSKKKSRRARLIANEKSAI